MIQIMKKFREVVNVFRARSSFYEAKADPKEYKRRWAEPQGYLPHGDVAIDAYNKVHPDEKIPTDVPISPESPFKGPKYLGQGAYGQVYKGTGDRVVKFDRYPQEKALYDLMPKRLKRHPITPQNVKTSQIEVPPDERHPQVDHGKAFTMSREDLHNLDLHDDHDRDAYDMIDNLMMKLNRHHLVRGSKSDPNTQKPYSYANIPHKASRLDLFQILHDWHKSVQGSPEIADYNKKRLKKFASGLVRYIHHGIVPSDMHSANLGKRADGTIAMRDLGIYSVIGDNSPKSINRLKSRKPLVSTKKLSPETIAKLKQMRGK